MSYEVRAVCRNSECPRFVQGMQAKTLADRLVFVLPNPSGRNAHFSYRTMRTDFARCARRQIRLFKVDKGNARGRTAETAVANFSHALCCSDNRIWPDFKVSSMKKAFPETYAPPGIGIWIAVSCRSRV